MPNVSGLQWPETHRVPLDVEFGGVETSQHVTDTQQDPDGDTHYHPATHIPLLYDNWPSTEKESAEKHRICDAIVCDLCRRKHRKRNARADVVTTVQQMERVARRETGRQTKDGPLPAAVPAIAGQSSPGVGADADTQRDDKGVSEEKRPTAVFGVENVLPVAQLQLCC